METTEKQKVSATEKRYAKYLGKLFWERDSTYNQETGKYDILYRLCMVVEMRRRPYTNRFMVMVQRLEGDGKDTWKQQASRFEREIKNGVYIMLDKANPQRPASYQADNWRG